MARHAREIAQVAEEARQVMDQLRQGSGDLVRTLTLVRGDGPEQTHVHARLPEEASALLIDILGFLARGQTVELIAGDAELTTQKAADLLGVSRPFLISRLLDTGRIPHRRTGGHRRIAFADVVQYRAERDAEARAAVDELTQLAQEMGLGYDKV